MCRRRQAASNMTALDEKIFLGLNSESNSWDQLGALLLLWVTHNMCNLGSSKSYFGSFVVHFEPKVGPVLGPKMNPIWGPKWVQFWGAKNGSNFGCKNGCSFGAQNWPPCWGPYLNYKKGPKMGAIFGSQNWPQFWPPELVPFWPIGPTLAPKV